MENIPNDNNLEQSGGPDMPIMTDVSTKPKKDWMLPASILIAGVLISVSVFYAAGMSSRRPVAQVPQNNVQNGAQAALPAIGDRDVILGDPKAPVTLVEYGDYQCPFCGRFAEQIEPGLRSDYIDKGKLRMVYRDFIVIDNFPGSKGESHLAAQAAECAKDQNKFWSYHDQIYKIESADGKENNGNLTTDVFMKIASDLKMDTKVFGECLNSKKYAKSVLDQSSGGERAGVQGTPSVFINGQSTDISYINNTIESLLNTQK